MSSLRQVFLVPEPGINLSGYRVHYKSVVFV